MKKFFSIMLLAMAALVFFACKDSKKDDPVNPSADPSEAPVLKGIDGVWYDGSDYVLVSKEKDIVGYLNTDDSENKAQFFAKYDSESEEEWDGTLVRPKKEEETVTLKLTKNGDNLDAVLNGDKRELKRFPYDDYKNYFGTWINEFVIEYNKSGDETNRSAIDAPTVFKILYSNSALAVLIGALFILPSYEWYMTLENGGNAEFLMLSTTTEQHRTWVYDGGLYVFDYSTNEDGELYESNFLFYNMQPNGKKMSFITIKDDGAYTKQTLMHSYTVEQVEKLLVGKTFTGKTDASTAYGKEVEVEATFKSDHTVKIDVDGTKITGKWSVTEERPHGTITVEQDGEVNYTVGKLSGIAVDFGGDEVVLGFNQLNGPYEEGSSNSINGNWCCSLNKAQ